MTIDFISIIFILAIDADTIKVNIPNVPDVFGKSIPIRLYKVDAPEKDCNFIHWNEGRKYVSTVLTKAKNIELRNCKRDKYFRLNCEVIFDGKNLREDVLAKKLVLPYGDKHVCKT